MLAFILVSAGFPVLAMPKTVTLDLPTMNCAMCPITVRKALRMLEGVTRVEIYYEDRKALVTFDDTQTSVAALIAATTNAGYPSIIHSKETP